MLLLAFQVQRNSILNFCAEENGNLKELLVPYPADQMPMWEISPRVNSPDNNDEALLGPIEALHFKRGPRGPDPELPLA